MDQTRSLKCSVSEFLALVNQTLDFAYPAIEVEGEVASFKVNQGKYVFFDLKDENGTVNCFMMVWQLRIPIEDGMKVIVTASPKLTTWGKFSLTVRAIRPTGEGSLKKSFELLKAKLDKEGIFALENKRSLPSLPARIGVISSTGAAGYGDFVKIINERWGGVSIDVAHVQVQGVDAPEQIIRALQFLNQARPQYDVIAVIRGGGSADDLAIFNDEPLVRAIAASRVPILTGIGHEVDTSLVDLAADVAASTPSNAAQLLVPDRRDVISSISLRMNRLTPHVLRLSDELNDKVIARVEAIIVRAGESVDRLHDRIIARQQLLAEFDPQRVLARGYAIVRGGIVSGNDITIETIENIITAEVKDVRKK